MNEVDLESTIGLLNRVASHEITQRTPTSEKPRPARVKARAARPQKPVRLVAGTRTYEIVYSFVRMTFRAYQRQHPGWFDPFLSMERPKKSKARRRGLESAEVARLFLPGVLLDAMERAVCAAMFWAGLRRSEIFGLLPEDLDWTTPKINVDHAWKNFGKKTRTLGDPKHHKHREAPFPDVLRKAIEALWEKNGRHQYVFSFADGSIPGTTWFREHVRAWFDRAGIDLGGRKITPHSARHSLASILEAQGTPIRYIQDLLGHSDYETTAGYLHTPMDMINRITESLDKAQGDDQDNPAPMIRDNPAARLAASKKSSPASTANGAKGGRPRRGTRAYMHVATGSMDTREGWISSYDPAELEARGVTAEAAFSEDEGITLVEVEYDGHIWTEVK